VAFGDDLARLELDLAMLDALAERIPAGQYCLDLGCGHAAASGYLVGLGKGVVGADLSSGMLRTARMREPELALIQADMRLLPFRTASFAAVVAYYSVQHVAKPDVTGLLSELARVLVPGGCLLVSVHLGDGHVVLEELLGRSIGPLGGCFYQRDELVGMLEDAGFAVEVEHQRGPFRHEVDTQRLYVLSRHPGPRSPAGHPGTL
jgi:ubiquinone/menaquinone biosynthesis C-methylase UbiE